MTEEEKNALMKKLIDETNYQGLLNSIRCLVNVPESEILLSCIHSGKTLTETFEYAERNLEIPLIYTAQAKQTLGEWIKEQGMPEHVILDWLKKNIDKIKQQ